MVLELKPGHATGLKELEQSAHTGALLEEATARFDAAEFDQAAEALEKILNVSSECAQVHFIHVHCFFLHCLRKVVSGDEQSRRPEFSSFQRS